MSVTGRPANNLRQVQNEGEAKPEAIYADSQLRTLIDVWPALPEAIKAGILALATYKHTGH